MCNAQLGSPHNHKTSNRSVHVQSTVHVLWTSCTLNTQQKTNLLLTETDSLSCFHPPHSAAVQAVVEDNQTRLTRAIHMQIQCEYSMQLIQLRIQNLSKVSQIYRWTDCEQIHSRIDNIWCRTFRLHRPLSTVYKTRQNCIQSFVRSWQRPTRLKHPASVVIDSATYLLTISSPDIDNVATSLYDIVSQIHNIRTVRTAESRALLTFLGDKVCIPRW